VKRSVAALMVASALILVPLTPAWGQESSGGDHKGGEHSCLAMVNVPPMEIHVLCVHSHP